MHGLLGVMVIYPGRRIPENIILKAIEKREYNRIPQPFWLGGTANPLIQMEHACTRSSAVHASGDACGCAFAHCLHGPVAKSSWPSGGLRPRGWEPLEYNIVPNILFRSVFSNMIFSTYIELKLPALVLKMTNGVSV